MYSVRTNCNPNATGLEFYSVDEKGQLSLIQEQKASIEGYSPVCKFSLLRLDCSLQAISLSGVEIGDRHMFAFTADSIHQCLPTFSKESSRIPSVTPEKLLNARIRAFMHVASTTGASSSSHDYPQNAESFIGALL